MVSAVEVSERREGGAGEGEERRGEGEGGVGEDSEGEEEVEGGEEGDGGGAGEEVEGGGGGGVLGTCGTIWHSPPWPCPEPSGPWLPGATEEIKRRVS